MSSAGYPQKRLSVRRGSIAASDPWGTHNDLNLNPTRSSSSVLTIVRVNPNVSTSPGVPFQDPPSSHSLSARRPSRRGGSSVQNVPAGGGSDQPPATRLSFAFSTFGGSKGSSDRPTSPTTSRSPARPASPADHRSSPSFAKPRLTPDQLVDLARQATHPKYAPVTSSLPDTPHSRPHSPLIQPHGEHLSHPQPDVAPATFTELPVSVYLPFIDRPSEVAALISSPPTNKLFALLAQTFPKPNSEYSPRAATKKTSSVPGLVPIDPTAWNYQELIAHLTTVTRETCSDVMWARNARRCIRAHSELVWERVKGALGIPPELDVDDFDVFESDDEDEPLARGIGLGRKINPQTASPIGIDDDGDTDSSEPYSPVRMKTKTTAHLEVPHSNIEDLVAPAVTIEPVIAEQPMSEDGALQGITEAAEDEAEQDDEAAGAAQQDYSPPPVQGLRISTIAVPSSAPLDSPTQRSHYPSAHPHSVPHSGSSSRSGSFSNIAGLRSAGFRRSDSFGSQAAALRRDSFGSFKGFKRSDSFGSNSGIRRSDSFGSASARAFSLAGLAGAGLSPTGVVRTEGREHRRGRRAGSISEFAFENPELPPEERAEGKYSGQDGNAGEVEEVDDWTVPMFPSNFAGLALAPTLGKHHHSHSHEREGRPSIEKAAT